MGEVAKELDLREAMESMKRTLPSIASVPLVEFRERVDQLPYSRYRKVEGYLLTGVLYLVLLVTLLVCIMFMVKVIKFRYKSNREPTENSTATAPTTRANSTTADSSLPMYVPKNVFNLD